ncbi:MAG TPA: hypothetical protein VFY78_10395, partial [Gammaproteobacteria bacterium]|nr:hypothetical protein [Gammaproteobacteria bacterium]
MVRVLKNTYLVAIFVLCTATACSAQEAAPGAQSFWKEFRQAIIAGNSKRLISLTQFPLELRGVVDDVPTKLIEQGQFNDVFTKVLSQPVVSFDEDKIITQSTKDIVVATQSISETDMMTKDSFRVDQLSFELKNKKWK